jgi:hypothetical protein
MELSYLHVARMAAGGDAYKKFVSDVRVEDCGRGERDGVGGKTTLRG